ncbi:MAG TPA: TIM barrel protein [Acidimicrobiales bacterium]|nr:TIM barrel protein [Acidimicrobiales bacterium]
MTYQLGIMAVTLAPLPVPEAARRAAELGFDHLDVAGDLDDASEPLAVPIGDRFTSPSPRPGYSTGAPPEGPGNWDRAVRAFRKAPGAKIEAWAGSIIDSVEKIKAFLAEVPDVRLLLDTGHVANWGEDPCELAPYAGHVQLRQARRGVPQTLEGDVDFARFLDQLRACAYSGLLSVEYFDLPELGFPLPDPLGHAVVLAEQIRPLL